MLLKEHHFIACSLGDGNEGNLFSCKHFLNCISTQTLPPKIPKRQLSRKPPNVTLVAFSHSFDYEKDILVQVESLKIELS